MSLNQLKDSQVEWKVLKSYDSWGKLHVLLEDEWYSNT